MAAFGSSTRRFGRGIPATKKRKRGDSEGAVFTTPHGSDRGAERDPEYVNAQQPPGGLIALDSGLRKLGTSFDFVQNISVVPTLGRVRLKKIFVDHLWDTINSHNDVLNWIDDPTGVATPQTITLPRGIYTPVNLALEMTSLMAAQQAGIVVLCPIEATTGRRRFNIASPTTDFQWADCPFIKYGNHVHGFAIRLPLRDAVPSSITGWGPDLRVQAAGPTQAAGYANMVHATFYAVRSNNLTRSQKQQSFGTSTQVMGVIYVGTQDQDETRDRDNMGQETLENVEPHQTSVTVVKQIGGDVDISLIDQYGFVAEATASVNVIAGGGTPSTPVPFNNAHLGLLFTITQHY